MCTYIHTCTSTCTCASQERGHWIPGAGIAGTCELPDLDVRSGAQFSGRAACAPNC